MTDDVRTRRLRELLRFSVSEIDDMLYEDPKGDFVRLSDVEAVLDTEGDRSMSSEGTQACICGRYPHTEECAHRDTEWDQPPEAEPGLALTLQNDFLAIGRLIEDNRNDFDKLARYLNRLIAALSRYFHDDKLIMFDREGLIRFINERADTEWDRQACAAQLVADCEPFLKDGETPAECIARNRADIDALMSLLAKAKATRADTEGDRPAQLPCGCYIAQCPTHRLFGEIPPDPPVQP